MGLLARTFNAIRPVPVAYSSPGFSMTTPSAGYQGHARSYMGNHIVYAAIEMRATSVGEPHIVGRRWRRESPQLRNISSNDGIRREIKAYESRLMSKGLALRDARQQMVQNGFYLDLPSHALVKLLNNPNPFMSRGQLWGTVTMDRDLAGNAYLYKARYESGLAGAVAELWRLRPDRVRIIPDATTHIAYYEYTVGRERVRFSAEDVIHFKTRHPLDEYYGMPPLMPLTGVTRIQQYMESFLTRFFEGGGASGPGSILTVKQKMSQPDKDLIRERFRAQFGKSGPGEMLVLDNAEGSYQQLGLARGLRDALPKEISNDVGAYIASVYGIPGSLLGLPIAYDTGNSYANKRQDWQVFWDLTMTPLLSDYDDVLNLALTPEFGMIDEVLFDLSDIRALQEDVDKVQDRHRKNVGAGLEFWEEGREAFGFDPNGEGTLLIPSNMVPVRVKRGGLIELPEPEPKQLPAPKTENFACGTCGSRLPVSNVVGSVTVFCRKCKQDSEVA